MYYCTATLRRFEKTLIYVFVGAWGARCLDERNELWSLTLSCMCRDERELEDFKFKIIYELIIIFCPSDC